MGWDAGRLRHDRRPSRDGRRPRVTAINGLPLATSDRWGEAIALTGIAMHWHICGS
jgi:hypothetical protein